MSVKSFLLRRVVFILPLLIGIVFFTFMLVRLGGQDPVEMLAGPTATQAQIDAISSDLGLDQPMLWQFWIYLGHVVQGDLGDSWISSRPVLSDILQRMPITLELLFLGIGLGAPTLALVVLAVPPLLAGVYSGIESVDPQTVDAVSAPAPEDAAPQAARPTTPDAGATP